MKCLSCRIDMISGIPDIKIQTHAEIVLQDTRMYSGPDLTVDNWSFLKTETPNLDKVNSETYTGKLQIIDVNTTTIATFTTTKFFWLLYLSLLWDTALLLCVIP